MSGIISKEDMEGIQKVIADNKARINNPLPPGFVNSTQNTKLLYNRHQRRVYQSYKAHKKD